MMLSFPPIEGAKTIIENPSNSAINDSISVKNYDTNTINKLKIHTKYNETIILSFKRDTIHIKFTNQKSQLKIPYSSPVDNVMPCNGIAVRKKRGQYIYVTHYLYNDSLLMLPLLDLNNRMNLLVVNIFNGRVLPINIPRETNFLCTYLTWFIFIEKSREIITSNSLDLFGKTLLHTFKITPTEILHVKSIENQSNFNIYEDENKMKDYINRIGR